MSAPQGLDQIAVRGISAIGYHGVLEHERREGQRFVVDVVVALDLGPAAESDDLSRTLDYGTLARGVHDAITSDPVDLIETLAERIAGVCLEFAAVGWTQVTVHKPAAPIAVTFTDVAVTIERSRT